MRKRMNTVIAHHEAAHCLIVTSPEQFIWVRGDDDGGFTSHCEHPSMAEMTGANPNDLICSLLAGGIGENLLIGGELIRSYDELKRFAAYASHDFELVDILAFQMYAMTPERVDALVTKTGLFLQAKRDELTALADKLHQHFNGSTRRDDYLLQGFGELNA